MFDLPALVSPKVINAAPSRPNLLPHSSSIFAGFELQNPKNWVFLRGRSFVLGFVEWGHCKRLLHTLQSLFFSLFSTFGRSRSRSRSTRRRKKTDLELPGCILFNTAMLICLFGYVCKVHGHGHARMDVPDVEVNSSYLVSGDKVYCRYEKASSASEAAMHHLSL